VAAGWSDAERANLLGVQACLWTEHVHDRPTIERLLFPRLTAFAERAWPCLPSPR
jgi:hexosaminidase